MKENLPDPLPQDLATFGKAVATLREASGLGQIELAEQMQAGSKFIVQEIEAGRPVDEQWLRKLPGALNCTTPSLQGIMDEAAGLQDVQKNPKPFGEAVRALRKARGWSGSVLAEKIDCGVNTISKIEKGEKVDLKWLHRIPAALECDNITVQGVFDAVAGMTDPIPADLKKFGESVTIVRERRLMTQQELGEAAIPPCSDTTIGRIENGDRQVQEKYLRAMAPALKCEPQTMQGVINEADRVRQKNMDSGLDPISGKPPAAPLPPPKPRMEAKPKVEKKTAVKTLPKAPVLKKTAATPAPAEPEKPQRAAVWSAIEKHMLANEMDAQELGKQSGIPGNIIESALKGEVGLSDNLLARIPPVFGAKNVGALIKTAEDLPAKGGNGAGKANIDAGNIDVTGEDWQTRIRSARARTRGNDIQH